MRPPLSELARTAKARDSWWTVALIDPLAIRLLWLIAPYRWITPNRVTLVSFVLGLGAAGLYFTGERTALIIGSVLFYFSFVVDCVDGKLARLRNAGTFVGAWLDFIFDRIRFLLATGALFVGQYIQTGNELFLIAGTAVLLIDLFHYVNGAEINQVSLAMRAKLADSTPPATNSADARSSMLPLTTGSPMFAAFRSFADFLQRHRIRPRLFSGVELEQIVCVVAPLTGFVLQVTGAVLTLHLVFEVAVIALMLRSTRNVTRRLRAGTDGPPRPQQRAAAHDTLPLPDPTRMESVARP